MKTAEWIRAAAWAEPKRNGIRQHYWLCRRVQDYVLSALALVVLFPLMLLIGGFVFLDDPHGSPIFAQTRVGRKGVLFTCYKFRSMVVGAEAQLDVLWDCNEMDGPVFKIREDPRITRVGKFLRKTSLDELPQLVNILKGEMSIVGPRPALPREAAQYTTYQRQRLDTLPGLTCFWQVHPNRHELKFEDWVELDLKYMRERSFWMDWLLIIKTLGAVFCMRGR